MRGGVDDALAKHLVAAKPVNFYTLTLNTWISGELLYLGTSLPNTTLSVNGISKNTDSSGNVVLDQRTTCQPTIDNWDPSKTQGCTVNKTYNVKIKNTEQTFTYSYKVKLRSSGCNDSGNCTYSQHRSQILTPETVTLKPN